MPRGRLSNSVKPIKKGQPCAQLLQPQHLNLKHKLSTAQLEFKHN